MNLSARQKKFLALANSEFGFDPWESPKGAPILRNDEINPLIEDGLVRHSGGAARYVWITTMRGRAALFHGDVESWLDF